MTLKAIKRDTSKFLEDRKQNGGMLVNSVEQKAQNLGVLICG